VWRADKIVVTCGVIPRGYRAFYKASLGVDEGRIGLECLYLVQLQWLRKIILATFSDREQPLYKPVGAF